MPGCNIFFRVLGLGNRVLTTFSGTCNGNVQDVVKTVKRYSKNIEEWAVWARQHSPLLLQVTTTNPLESYHSGSKGSHSNYMDSLVRPLNTVAMDNWQHHQQVSSTWLSYCIRPCIKIDEVDNMKEAQCKRAEENFCTKRISEMHLSETVLEQVHMFPFPVQELIIGEAREMRSRIQKSKAPPELTTPECNCLFFSRCLLPCHHILHTHIFGTDPPE